MMCLGCSFSPCSDLSNTNCVGFYFVCKVFLCGINIPITKGFSAVRYSYWGIEYAKGMGTTYLTPTS